MAQYTIKDIAKALGVAPSTVSRALHDHPDISNKTKERIVAFARKHKYRPNLIATSLQNSRTKVIGVIVPAVEHYFFAAVISGIEDVAHKAGYTIMVCQSQENLEREVRNVQALVAHCAAGVLISTVSGNTGYAHLQELVQHGIPLVQFDRVVEGLKTATVVVDDYKGAYAGVCHLVEAGYRRIAHLAGPQHVAIGRERLRGYRQALADHGLPFVEGNVVYGGFHEHDGERGVAALLSMPTLPDAIFAVNDPVAIGVYRVLRAKGIRIPHEMALLGFCNSPQSELVEPAMSTVDQPAWRMGQEAAQLLLAQCSGQAHTEQTRVLPTKLLVRASTRAVSAVGNDKR